MTGSPLHADAASKAAAQADKSLRPARIVLASSSPSRLSILNSAGVYPEVHKPDLDEDAFLDPTLDPAQQVLLLARLKCEAVARQLDQDCLVIAADSMFELGGKLHGKPKRAEVARAQWPVFSGQNGTLHTGHWLSWRGQTQGQTRSVPITFGQLDQEEMEAYIATGEPLEVAGGFTIEGLGAPFIEQITGDPSCVMGLSLPLMRQLVRKLGLSWNRLYPAEAPCSPAETHSAPAQAPSTQAPRTPAETISTPLT